MKRLLTTLVILTGFIGSAGDVWADTQSDYQKGRAADQAGDFTEAAKWYRKAAEQGVAQAQNRLGVMYARGQGVTQDIDEALKWYRKAAEQGYAGTLYKLGLMYRDGHRVTQDYVEAVKWFRKLAEQGKAGWQENLKELKNELGKKWVDQCLFENIEKVTGPETKSIVEKHCYRKIEHKSLEWLARNVD
ncbi:sel1 repeat family protein [Alphaproteobacteria bacterium]|nr:sel1 repeat family protein [Alphaproteobacteria bacterium]